MAPAPDHDLLDQLARVYMQAAVDALVAECESANKDDDAEDTNVAPAPNEKDDALAAR